MKKLITALMAFILSAACFAETGYNGYQWKLNKLYFEKKGEKLTSAEKEIWEDTLIKVKGSILGETANYYYFFPGDNLQSVSYITSEENIETIKSKFSKKIVTTEFETNINKINQIKYINDFINKYPKEKEKIYIYLFSSEAEYISNAGYKDFKPFEETKKTENVILSIYDYNDDTNVFIYENLGNDKAVVVYVPHEQDY